VVVRHDLGLHGVPVGTLQALAEALQFRAVSGWSM
jgi:hypothetical protein